MNKTKLTLAALAALALGACHKKDCDVQPTVQSIDICGQNYETQEIDANSSDPWVMLGRAQFARAMKYIGASPFAAGTYQLDFTEKFGFGRQLLVQLQPDGEYVGSAPIDGFEHTFKFNPNGGTILVDQNGDFTIEARDTLENKVSRCEQKPVEVGQHFLIADTFGKELVKYQAYTPTEVKFSRQDGTGYAVALYMRPDGAFGGDLVIDGQTYMFAMKENGSLIVDRNRDSNLENFVSQGLPGRAYGGDLSTIEATSDIIQLGPVSKVYTITPAIINKYGDNGKGTVVFSINGEVSPELKATEKFVTADGAVLRLHSVDPGNSLNWNSIANYSLHTD